MTKFRIALVSALAIASLAGGLVASNTAAHPSHTGAGPVLCCAAAHS